MRGQTPWSTHSSVKRLEKILPSNEASQGNRYLLRRMANPFKIELLRFYWSSLSQISYGNTYTIIPFIKSANFSKIVVHWLAGWNQNNKRIFLLNCVVLSHLTWTIACYPSNSCLSSLLTNHLPKTNSIELSTLGFSFNLFRSTEN